MGTYHPQHLLCTSYLWLTCLTLSHFYATVSIWWFWSVMFFCSYPIFENPYPMMIHESPVTSCEYLADCPVDLVPALYSVGSRQKRQGYSKKVQQRVHTHLNMQIWQIMMSLRIKLHANETHFGFWVTRLRPLVNPPVALCLCDFRPPSCSTLCPQTVWVRDTDRGIYGYERKHDLSAKTGVRCVSCGSVSHREQVNSDGPLWITALLNTFE